MAGTSRTVGDVTAGHGRETLFRPTSVTWRVNQEPALLLGGGRALLMQLAHPGVAAGVAEHSDFRQRPVARLLRTLELTLALTFGSRAEALAAAHQINTVHQRVRGRGYSATDPRLLLWVHAKLIGGLLGLANSRYPAGIEQFDDYLSAMLGGPELLVDGRARELARAVLRPPLQRVPPPVFRPLEAITAGLLPASLRLDYGLRWGRVEQM